MTSPDHRAFGPTERFEHVCEVCGKTAILTSGEAYWSGWDYPPEMGVFGVISPRTCERCGLDATVWWALQMNKLTLDDLTPDQLQTIARIRNEIPD
jgi:hypothetical protein